MSDYLQPSFYRFNEDSIKLINFVREHVNQASTILDIGAGSGIIGIELFKSYQSDFVTFLELQGEWLTYLEHNIKSHHIPLGHFNVIISSLGEWQTEQKFDLIVSNPPYYLSGHGEQSSDLRRHLSRTFEVDGWEVLLKKISILLKRKGLAFVISRKNSHINKIIKSFEKNINFEFFEFDQNWIVKLTRLQVN